MRIHWFLLRKELVKIVSTVGRNDSIPCFLQHTCNSVHLHEKFLPMVVPLKKYSKIGHDLERLKSIPITSNKHTSAAVHEHPFGSCQGDRL